MHFPILVQKFLKQLFYPSYMAAITKLEIDGFKAFPTSFSLDFSKNGASCNFLIYGENGSGKSSIYYALHAIFQSVFKSDEGAKYFRPDDMGNDEYLVNIYRIEDVIHKGYNPYITLHLDNGNVVTLNRNGIFSSTGNKLDLTQLNRSSAFINHSYISRFHSARNSETIDLWPVFYKDILPFFIPSGGTEYLSQIYDNVNQFVVDRHPRVTNRYVKDRVSYFNKSLKSLIEGINQNVSGIYNSFFKEVGDRNLLIKLLYTEESDSENKYHERCYWRFYGSNKPFPAPHIGLYIYEDKGTLKWRRERRRRRKREVEINKPQTYFNEAKLTAIALSVRFACLSHHPVSGSFLALDDMLISLDMSNRMHVIRYLLDELFEKYKYKLFVFTHDRLFYHTFKRIIETQYDNSVWKFGGLFINDENSPVVPEFMLDSQSKINDAVDAYRRHDYFMCGMMLRKECEEKLKGILPESLRMKESSTGTEKKNLDEQILSLEEFCLKEKVDFSPFKNLKIYKDLFLNSTAHNDIESPFYRQEIKLCLESVKTLSAINRNEHVNCKKHLSFDIYTPALEKHTVRITCREPLLILDDNGNKRLSYYSKCVIDKIISEAGEVVIGQGESSIYDAFDWAVDYLGAPIGSILMDTLRDRNGIIRDRL